MLRRWRSWSSPRRPAANLQRLAAAGAAGDYGFYEAVDYAPARLATRAFERGGAIVHGASPGDDACSRSRIVLLGRPMQHRFERLPEFQATLLLLQERIPKAAAPYVHHAAIAGNRGVSSRPAMPVRVLPRPDTATPEVQFLSNGHYHVMVTNAGGGYSRWKDLAVTRWREDATRDHWGTFCYMRDLASGAFWSAAHQPTLTRAEHYEATSRKARVEFRRQDHDYETRLEIVVSPEDDIELRRLHITNCSRIRARDRRDELCGSGACAARQRTRRIPRSAISSCRRRSWRRARTSCARGGLAPWRARAVDVSSHGGARADPRITCRTKPTVCGLSAAAVRFAEPRGR